MIFVTVGTQLPFDRLIKMIDEMAPELDQPILAQTGVSAFVPKNIEWKVNFEAASFEATLAGSALIVAHAGMGTFLKAKKYRKPIIMVPRRSDLSEHRNDHQLATVSQLSHHAGVYIAENKEDLRSLMRQNLLPVEDSETSLKNRVQLLDFLRGKVLEFRS